MYTLSRPLAQGLKTSTEREQARAHNHAAAAKPWPSSPLASLEAAAAAAASLPPLPSDFSPPPLPEEGENVEQTELSLTHRTAVFDATTT